MFYSVAVGSECYPLAFPQEIPPARQKELYDALVSSNILERMQKMPDAAARRALLYGLLRVVVDRELGRASRAAELSRDLRNQGVRKEDLAA